jgi:hypothetical protein
MERRAANGYTFHFVCDDDGNLHVNYRPGITPEIAIDTFFEGVHVWNPENQRYQTYTETYGVYWAWLYDDAAASNVLVISCFPLEDE